MTQARRGWGHASQENILSEVDSLNIVSHATESTVLLSKYAAMCDREKELAETCSLVLLKLFEIPLKHIHYMTQHN